MGIGVFEWSVTDRSADIRSATPVLPTFFVRLEKHQGVHGRDVVAELNVDGLDGVDQGREFALCISEMSFESGLVAKCPKQPRKTHLVHFRRNVRDKQLDVVCEVNLLFFGVLLFVDVELVRRSRRRRPVTHRSRRDQSRGRTVGGGVERGCRVGRLRRVGNRGSGRGHLWLAGKWEGAKLVRSSRGRVGAKGRSSRSKVECARGETGAKISSASPNKNREQGEKGNEPFGRCCACWV